MNKVVSKSFVQYKVAEAIGYEQCCWYLGRINNNFTTVLLFFVLSKIITSPKSMLFYELKQTNFPEVDEKLK